MSVLMEQRVDWSAWATTAAALTCPACETSFQPNHPRRRFCGRPECPGRTRKRSEPTPRPRPAARAPRRRRTRIRVETNQLAALIAETTLALHAHEFDGTGREVAEACIELARSIATHRAPAAERALTVRVLAAATARAANIGKTAHRG